MVAEHGISVRQACRTVRLARSAFYAPRRPRDDAPIVTAIQRYVQDNPRHGFDKLYPALRPEGFVNGKAVFPSCGNQISPPG
jgi:putative transposase